MAVDKLSAHPSVCLAYLQDTRCVVRGETELFVECVRHNTGSQENTKASTGAGAAVSCCCCLSQRP